MAHEVSATLRDAIYRGRTERVFIVLLSITHPRLTETIRFSSDGRDTVSNGIRYQSFPFRIALPDDRQNAQPRAQLEIPNVDYSIITFLRTVPTPATVEIRVVLDSDPNRVERGPWVMELVDVSYTIESVRGTIRAPSLLSEPFPAESYNATDYIGL